MAPGLGAWSPSWRREEWQLGLLSVALECAGAAPHIRAEQEAGGVMSEAETMEHALSEHGCHSEAKT